MAGIPFLRSLTWSAPFVAQMLTGLQTKFPDDRQAEVSSSHLEVGSSVAGAKKQRSVALSSWENELFSAMTASTRSLGIQSELRDLASSCTVIVASDSQSVRDHSRRRGHSFASKRVGLRRLCLHEAIAIKKLALEEAHTAVDAADVCTKALPGDKIRAEDAMGVDPGHWSLSQLDDRSSGEELCHHQCFEQPHEAETEGAC